MKFGKRHTHTHHIYIYIWDMVISGAMIGIRAIWDVVRHGVVGEVWKYNSMYVIHLVRLLLWNMITVRGDFFCGRQINLIF